MSSDGCIEEESPIAVILDANSVEISEDLPMDQWSSFVIVVPEKNKKHTAFEEGLYSPGSEEICTKYLAQSDNIDFEHPYCNYPAISDPGIKNSLLKAEEKVIYRDNGQELYLATCKDMNQCPIGIFYRSLLKDTIRLSYYGLDPKAVRAMTMALQFNKNVKVLDLTDNFLSHDACFHLGKMLSVNCTLQELNLSGCRIGHEGARRLLAGLHVNRNLQVLNLSRNVLEDAGVKHLALAIYNGIDVQDINLSYNEIGSKGANALAETIEYNNKFKHINLSWNNLFTPLGVCNLLNCLQENDFFEELNLSWNSLAGPQIAASVKNAMVAPNLRHLDLSNNKFEGEAITNIIANMGKAKNLITLNLSYNPMSPQDAIKVLAKMKFASCKVQNLLMDNVTVNSDFLMLLELVKQKKFRKNAVVTYGRVLSILSVLLPDLREIVLNRAEYLSKKPKRTTVDIALVILEIVKEQSLELMDLKEFQTALQRRVRLDNDLIEEIGNAFPGPKSKKTKTINLNLLVDYIRRKWPDRRLPPTPPPEPEPEPKPLKKRKSKKKNKSTDKEKNKGKK